MFVLMLTGDGWKIVNETLFISNPTGLQLKNAFTEASNPQQQQQSQQQQRPDDNTVRQMVQQLAAKTNMNEKFTAM